MDMNDTRRRMSISKLSMKWICAVIGLALLVAGGTEARENSRHRRDTQVSKCPYSVVDMGSMIHTEGRSRRGVWGFISNIYGKVFGKQDSSTDRIGILSPTTVKYDDCQSPSTQSNLKCNSSYPYRSYDGSCNNLQYPSWGMSEVCQLRLLPASYEGSDGFRNSIKGNPLPQPRDLSLRIMPEVDLPSPIFAHTFVFFGQFVVHDIMLTPTPTRNLESCCPYDAKNRARQECFPIFIKADDPFYSQYNTTCLNFERTNECFVCNETDKIQKFNNATAFLDLSMVYGRTEEQADDLRTKDGTGKLLSENDGQGELPPRNDGVFSNFCPLNVSALPEISVSTDCFKAGDDRIDQHSTLTSMHTLLLREHNRVAQKLKDLNPQWNDETLYQETRKILVGQWQNIVYNEYLPLALGPRHMTHFGLWVSPDSSGTKYNASARPGVWLEVSTAGFRLHSMVASITGTKNIRFWETFSNPGLIRDGCAETLLEGACRVPSQEFDRYFVTDVADLFLKQPENPDGLDTASIDIQRGRDNGLPPYGKMVEYLTGGRKKVASYGDLSPLMSKKNIDLLKKNYASVKDVDLWVGLQLEKHAPNSVLGFNTATLTALQFHFLKYGDRLYFEHESSFTKAQLTSIKQSSFARFLCDNIYLESIQKYALLLAGSDNPVVDCDEIAVVDVTPWKTDR